jgi:hypothetical protein
MNAATIAALATAIPAIVGALTALIWAIRGKQTASVAHDNSVSAKLASQRAEQIANQAYGLAGSNKDALQSHVEGGTPHPPA